MISNCWKHHTQFSREFARSPHRICGGRKWLKIKKQAKMPLNIILRVNYRQSGGATRIVRGKKGRFVIIADADAPIGTNKAENMPFLEKAPIEWREGICPGMGRAINTREIVAHIHHKSPTLIKAQM
jgi:hypothetical protein